MDNDIDTALENLYHAEECIAYHIYTLYQMNEELYGKNKAWCYLKGVFALDIPVLKRLASYYASRVQFPRAIGISPQVVGAIVNAYAKGKLSQEIAWALCNEAIDARYTLESVKDLLKDNTARSLVTSEQASKALGEAEDYLGGSMDRLDTASVEMQLAASKPLGLVKKYLAQAAKREGEAP